MILYGLWMLMLWTSTLAGRKLPTPVLREHDYLWVLSTSDKPPWSHTEQLHCGDFIHLADWYNGSQAGTVKYREKNGCNTELMKSLQHEDYWDTHIPYCSARDKATPDSNPAPANECWEPAGNALVLWSLREDGVPGSWLRLIPALAVWASGSTPENAKYQLLFNST